MLKPDTGKAVADGIYQSNQNLSGSNNERQVNAILLTAGAKNRSNFLGEVSNDVNILHEDIFLYTFNS